MFNFLSRIFRRNHLSRANRLSLQQFFGNKIFSKLMQLYKRDVLTASDILTITPPAASVFVEDEVVSLLEEGFFTTEELLGITAESASALTNSKVRSLLQDGLFTKSFLLCLNRTGLKALNAKSTISLVLDGVLEPRHLPTLSHATLSVLDDNIVSFVKDGFLSMDFILNVSERIAIGLKGHGVKELLKLGYLSQDDLLLLTDNAFKLLQNQDVVSVLTENPDVIAKEELFNDRQVSLDDLQKNFSIEEDI